MMLKEILFGLGLFAVWLIYYLIKKPYSNPYLKEQEFIRKKTFAGVTHACFDSPIR